MTHYDTLQVQRSAPIEVIRASYRVLVSRYHPDRFEPKDEGLKRTAELNEAYRVLSDTDLRSQYDADLDRADGKERPSNGRTHPDDGANDAHREAEFSGPGSPQHGETVDSAKTDPSWHFWVWILMVFIAVRVGGIALAGSVAVGFMVWKGLKRSNYALRAVAAVSTTASLFVAAVALVSLYAPQHNVSPDAAVFSQPTSEDHPDSDRATAVPVAVDHEWAAAQQAWQDVNAEFMADSTRFVAMQGAVNEILAERGGSIDDSQLLQEAFELAATRTGWPVTRANQPIRVDDVKWQTSAPAAQPTGPKPYDGPVVPLSPQDEWESAQRDWWQQRAEFMADPTRRAAMQRAIEAIDSETGGTLAPADLLARAYERAAMQTGWLTVIHTTPEGKPARHPFEQQRIQPTGGKRSRCVFKPVMTDKEIAACRD